MSGGFFSYSQFHIEQIADSIESELNTQGKQKPKEELWNRKEFYEEYSEEKFYPTYPKEIQREMKNAIKFLRIAHVYAQRVDWFLSGDDGEESFIERLKEDLDALKKQ